MQTRRTCNYVVVILLMIGALIHDICALQCYNCSSPPGGSCDDPLDINNTQVITCPSEADVCTAGRAKLFVGGTQHCTMCCSLRCMTHE